jgi:DNA-binding response OmpR family regulator
MSAADAIALVVGGAEAEAEFPDIAVLVADSDPQSQAALRDSLRGLVGQVFTAHSGAAAAAILKSEHVDVVVLDAQLRMPDAFTLTELAKSRGVAAVIILLSPDTPTDRGAAQLAGCDTFLIRPVNEVILREVVAEYVDEF